jgi:mono/diheme cytochrome c family protein
MKHMWYRTLLSASVAGWILIGPTDVGTQSRIPQQPPVTPRTIADGRKTFQQYCRPCHGADAKGNGPGAPEGSKPPNLTDDVWLHGPGDQDVFRVIWDGVPPKFDMKSFKSQMTATEVWSLVHYLRTLNPASQKQ